MATNLVKLHFLATKGNFTEGEKVLNGSNAILIQDYDPVNDKYVYGMIDTGYYEGSTKSQFDKELLLRYLKAHNITALEFVLITHYHRDHFGNLIYLLKNYPTEKIKIKNLILPMDEEQINTLESKMAPGATDTMKKRLTEIKNAFVKYKTDYASAKMYFFGKTPKATIEDICKIGTGTFKFYNTDDIFAEYPTYLEDSSNGGTSDKFSIVAVYSVQGRKVLFAGDIYSQSEKILKKQIADDYDLIQMSHHGSSSANCQELLDVIVPADKECTAIQLRGSSYNSIRAIRRYLAMGNVNVYGVYQDFELEWGNTDASSRGSIVAEIKDGIIRCFTRRVYGSESYAQKLIHPVPQNNVNVDAVNTNIDGKEKVEE